MLIARAKKKENIAEYVIYMWQLEDFLRAKHLDIDELQASFIDNFDQPDEVRQEMRTWYADIMNMMKEEQVAEKGHIQIIKNVVNDMNELHLALMRSPKHVDYNVMFFNMVPVLSEYRQRTQATAEVNDVELGLNMLYHILLFRLEKREISEGTLNAVKQVSRFLAILSDLYKKDENNELEM